MTISFDFKVAKMELPPTSGGNNISDDMLRLLKQMDTLPPDKVLKCEVGVGESKGLAESIKHHVKTKKLPFRVIQRGGAVYIARKEKADVKG